MLDVCRLPLYVPHFFSGLEVVRLQQYDQDNIIIQTVGSLNVTAVNISVLAQVPGYLLMAIAEVLAIVTGLEFAYSQAPPSMRSMVVAVFYFTAALGNYLGMESNFANANISRSCIDHGSQCYYISQSLDWIRSQ